jgi:hypothetical protein
MEGPLWELLIPFWSVNKHGRHGQFLFLIGRFLKQLCQMIWNLVGSIYGRSSSNNKTLNARLLARVIKGPSIDASYHVSVHLAKLFQSRRFLESDQSETKIACGGHVCLWIGTKWAIFIENLPTKFRFIWQSGFREDFLEINQSETRIVCGGHVC